MSYRVYYGYGQSRDYSEDQLRAAKSLARQYEGAQVEQRNEPSRYHFVRWICRNGRLVRTH